MTETEKKIAEIREAFEHVGYSGMYKAHVVDTLLSELDREREENRKLRERLKGIGVEEYLALQYEHKQLRAELQSAQQEIERLKQERAELIEGLRTGLMRHGSWSADDYAAYMRDILREVGVTTDA